MFKQIKQNLPIFLTIITWLIVGGVSFWLMYIQLSQTKPQEVPSTQNIELSPKQIEDAVEFATQDRLTVPDSSVTLETSESAQTP